MVEIVAEPIIGDLRTFFVLTWTIPSCKLLGMEGEHDEEELSFVRLAAATANVVRFLETQKQESEHRKPETKSGRENESEGNKHRRDIDCELQKERTVE